MVRVFPRFLKILLIILGIGLIAGAIILLVENNPELEKTPDYSTEVLAQNFQTIIAIDC